MEAIKVSNDTKTSFPERLVPTQTPGCYVVRTPAPNVVTASVHSEAPGGGTHETRGLTTPWLH